MKKITKFIALIGMAFIMLCSSSCATMTGGRIGDCQKTKPKAGQPKRQVRTGKLVGDIVLGACCFGVGIPVFIIIDFSTSAIWKPCGDSLVIDQKTGEKKRKKFVK